MGKYYHISHTDLDGYSCQLISTIMVKNDLVLINVDYGNIIYEFKKLELTEFDTLLITDLNLSEEEALRIDTAQKEIGFKLQLLDHHKSDIHEKYEWYLQDRTKCATMLTFEYFGKPEQLELFANIINAYDIWLEDNEHFPKGKCMDRVVGDYRNTFPKELPYEEKEFILAALYNANEMFKQGYSVAEVERKRYDLERTLFLDGSSDNENLTFHEVKVRYFTDKIMKQETYQVVTIHDFDVYVFTGLSRIFQIFSHKILSDYPHIDAAININPKGGRLSMRTRKDEVDLTVIAKKYFNGDGHPKASGGSLDLDMEKKFSTQELFDIFNERIS